MEDQTTVVVMMVEHLLDSKLSMELALVELAVDLEALNLEQLVEAVVDDVVVVAVVDLVVRALVVDCCSFEVFPALAAVLLVAKYVAATKFNENDINFTFKQDSRFIFLYRYKLSHILRRIGELC
jgi:hypothetical protein